MVEAAMIDEDSAEPIDCPAGLDLSSFLGSAPEGERKSAADRLRKLHSDPAFATARDERGRERFNARRAEMQRLSNAARRGYDVPPDREAEWKVLKRKRTLSNAEIGRMLGLKKWRKPKDRKGKRGL